MTPFLMYYGSELRGRVLHQWAYDNGVRLQFIEGDLQYPQTALGARLLVAPMGSLQSGPDRIVESNRFLRPSRSAYLNNHLLERLHFAQFLPFHLSVADHQNGPANRGALYTFL